MPLQSGSNCFVQRQILVQLGKYDVIYFDLKSYDCMNPFKFNGVFVQPSTDHREQCLGVFNGSIRLFLMRTKLAHEIPVVIVLECTSWRIHTTNTESYFYKYFMRVDKTNKIAEKEICFLVDLFTKSLMLYRIVNQDCVIPNSLLKIIFQLQLTNLAEERLKS